MYKEASKLKLRVQTSRGPLTVEQLWDLPLTELDSLAVQLEESYNNSKGKSFLEKKTKKDKTLKLTFDVVLDILETKVKNEDRARKAAETREQNQKIMSLISEKEEEELKGKSKEELLEMIKK